MKIQHLLAYSFLLLACFSCRYSKTPEVFTDKNVSIEYPSYLFKTDDVYPEKNTLLQLKNDYRDVFFILIDHGMKPGEQGFEMMCDSIMNQLKRNLREPNIEASDTIFTTTNNLKVKEFHISGILSSKGKEEDDQVDHRFYFVIDVFETKDGHLYQTAGWLLRHKRQLWLKDLQKSAYSLRTQP